MKKQAIGLIIGAMLIAALALATTTSITKGNYRMEGTKFTATGTLFEGKLVGINKQCESYAKQEAPYLVYEEQNNKLFINIDPETVEREEDIFTHQKLVVVLCKKNETNKVLQATLNHDLKSRDDAYWVENKLEEMFS